jgi:alpha-1,2-mannosyltransferase
MPRQVTRTMLPSQSLRGIRLSELAQWTLAAVSAGLALCLVIAYSGHTEMDLDVYRNGGAHLLSPALYTSQLHLLGRTLPFLYPPFAALLFWPFSHVSVDGVQMIWNVVNAMCLFGVLALSIAGARGRKPASSDWRLALMLSLPVMVLWPVRSDFALGQINLFLVLIIVADLTCTLSFRGHRLPRGVLVGVAAAIKLTPLVFIPYLALSRQRREACHAALTFLGCTAAMFAVTPRNSWIFWTKYADDTKRLADPTLWGNQAIHGAIARLGVVPSPSVVTLVSGLVLVAGVFLAAVAYRRSSAFLGLLVSAVTGLIISPISWSHHYVWILPVLAWLTLAPDRPRFGRWWALGAVILYVQIPLWASSIAPQHSGIGWYLKSDSYVLSAIAFLALVAIMLWHRSSIAPQPDFTATSPLSSPRAIPSPTRPEHASILVKVNEPKGP